VRNDALLEKSVDTSDRELESSARRARLGRLLRRWGLSSLSSLSALASDFTSLAALIDRKWRIMRKKLRIMREDE
jgi:hypothetical protein